MFFLFAMPVMIHVPFLFLQGKFLSFYQYKNFNNDKFNYEDLLTTDSVFMRWKVISHAFYKAR